MDPNIILSILAEMRKMTEANAQLLTIIQQQTQLINEQKQVLNEILSGQASLQTMMTYR